MMKHCFLIASLTGLLSLAAEGAERHFEHPRFAGDGLRTVDQETRELGARGDCGNVDSLCYSSVDCCSGVCDIGRRLSSTHGTTLVKKSYSRGESDPSDSADTESHVASPRSSKASKGKGKGKRITGGSKKSSKITKGQGTSSVVSRGSSKGATDSAPGVCISDAGGRSESDKCSTRGEGCNSDSACCGGLSCIRDDDGFMPYCG
jgi:hypothetical protein